MKVLGVKGSSGPQLLAGDPSGLLDFVLCSFAPFGHSGRVTHATVRSLCLVFSVSPVGLHSMLAFG